jgi:POT family proton-dependent oligopeptide transporter
VLLSLGYVALVSSRALALIPALLLLILGNALFKPSTQAVLMGLYPPQDRRIEAIQTWFYMAANAGAGAGALVAGIVAHRQGWSRAFALAAAAMLTACALVAANRRALRALTIAPPGLNKESANVRSHRRLLTVAALIFAMFAYTVCAAQVEGSLLLWAQGRTNRVLFGFEIPAAWFVALPSLLVVVLGAAQFVWLPQIQRRIDLRTLIAIGLLVVGLAFVVLIPVSTASDTQRMGMGWLVGTMFLLVVGELLVAPLGLAQVLRLLPPRHCGLAVGGWYLSGALGHWLSGEIGVWSSLGSGVAGLLVLFALPVASAVVLRLSWLADSR